MVDPVNGNSKTDEKQEEIVQYVNTNTEVQIIEDPSVKKIPIFQALRNLPRENPGENRSKPSEDGRPKKSTNERNLQTASYMSTNVLQTCTSQTAGNIGGSGGDERKPNRQNNRNGGCADSHVPKKNARPRRESNDDQANEGSEQPAENPVDETREGYNATVVHEQLNNNGTSITNVPVDTKLADNGQVDFAVRPAQHTTTTFLPDNVIEKPGIDQDVFDQPLPNRVEDSPTPLRENNRGEVTEDRQEDMVEMSQPEDEHDDIEYALENIQVRRNSSDELQYNSDEQGPESSSGNTAHAKQSVGTQPIQENAIPIERRPRTIPENMITNGNSSFYHQTSNAVPVSTCIAVNMSAINRTCAENETRRMLKSLFTGTPGRELVEPAPVNENITISNTPATASGQERRNHVNLDHNQKRLQRTIKRRYEESVNQNGDRIPETNYAEMPSTSQANESAGSVPEGWPSVVAKPAGGPTYQNPERRHTNAKKRKIERPKALDDQPSTSIARQNPKPRQTKLNGRSSRPLPNTRNSQNSALTRSPADEDLDTGQISSAENIDRSLQQYNNPVQVVGTEPSLENIDLRQNSLLEHSDTGQPMETIGPLANSQNEQANQYDDENTAGPSRSNSSVIGSMMSYRNTTCFNPRDPQENRLEQPIETPGSSMFFDSIFQTMRRIEGRTEQRYFYHPEDQYTEREVCECWHCEEWINRYGRLPPCDYCGDPWCQACQRSCGETRQRYNRRDDDKLLRVSIPKTVGCLK